MKLIQSRLTAKQFGFILSYVWIQKMNCALHDLRVGLQHLNTDFYLMWTELYFCIDKSTSDTQVKVLFAKLGEVFLL